ncbi:MAG: ChaN family lipoprotein [Armatimonadetes bacterium]|nr:ChaN family lipoprotein [Armatimonadota bacterium]
MNPLTLAVAAALMGPAPKVSPADPAQIAQAGQIVSFESMVAELSRADVVCVGEQHGFAAGHAFQARLLAALGSAQPRLGLSLEMFERDVQLTLDEYLSGHISESAFLAASRPWPRYKTDYRPMVEWSREAGKPVIAANPPRRYVNMVSRGGQQALLRLPRASRAWLPRVPYSMDLSPAYDAELTRLFKAPHGSAAPAGMPSADNMKQAQALWDHGMADSIIAARKRHRLRTVVHICGSMHCERGFGVVERLRKASGRLRVMTVILRPTPAPGEQAPASDLGDFVVACGPVEPGPAARP